MALLKVINIFSPQDKLSVPRTFGQDCRPEYFLLLIVVKK